MKTVGIVVVSMIAIQMLVVWLITHFNGHVFKKYTRAAQYPQAIAELGKTKPIAALVIKVCYGEAN